MLKNNQFSKKKFLAELNVELTNINEQMNNLVLIGYCKFKKGCLINQGVQGFLFKSHVEQIDFKNYNLLN